MCYISTAITLVQIAFINKAISVELGEVLLNLLKL